MSRYILIRRLRGPAFLLLIGVLALLRQTHVIEHFWHLFWPLLLILLGVFMLVERAALAADGGYSGFPGAPFSDQFSQQGSGTGIPPYPGQPTALAIPPRPEEREIDPEGGQS
jgi:hypothetical protein